MRLRNYRGIQKLTIDNWLKGIACSVILFSLSCVPNKSYQTPGASELQGIWVENPGPEKSNPDNIYYSKFQLRFSCDSVYITTEVHSKYNYGDSHCFNEGHWYEYQKAGYTLAHDSLILDGVFTKPNFRMKISGCYHSGNFHEVFKIKKLIPNDIKNANGKDSLLIYPPHEEGLVHLYRTDKWVCKPHVLE